MDWLALCLFPVIPDFDTAQPLRQQCVGTNLEIALAELFQPSLIIWNGSVVICWLEFSGLIQLQLPLTRLDDTGTHCVPRELHPSENFQR